MSEFTFDLHQPVRLFGSAEHGIVVGRAEYTTSDNSYLVRYVAADGRLVEEWWGESTLVEAPLPKIAAA